MESHLEKIKRLVKGKKLSHVDIDFGAQLFEPGRPFSYVRFKEKGKILYEERGNETGMDRIYGRADYFKKGLEKIGVHSTLYIGGHLLTRDLIGMLHAEKKKKED